MSDVVVCRGCKKFFNYLPKGLCVECLDARDEVFRRVREYVYANPGATITEVADETGVDLRTVRELIRDGELQWTPADMIDSDDALTCELCGDLISAGRHCDSCRARLLGGLAPVDEQVAADHQRYQQRDSGADPSGARRMWRRT